MPATQAEITNHDDVANYEMLDRDGILYACDQATEFVATPEWGEGTGVFVRSMTAEERDAFEAGINDGERRNLRNLRGRFAALTISDDRGSRLFEDGDAVALGKKNAAALDRIWDVGRRLNRMTDEALEQAEKNSEGTPDDCSCDD